MAEEHPSQIVPGSDRCGACGEHAGTDAPAPFAACRACGARLLRAPGPGGSLHPFVAPALRAESAWSNLKRQLAEAARAELTSSRLLMVPFHDRGREAEGIPRGGEAVTGLSAAADLLPAGLDTKRIGSRRSAREAFTGDLEERCRSADPDGAPDLLRLAEPVDVMLPPATETSRLWYVPFWFMTYRIDHVERCGVVDAVSGRPVGPSAAPSRWLPAVAASGAGFAGFLLISLAAIPLGLPLVQALVAGALSWGAAYALLSRGILRQRGR